jgi:hypothetical protein
VAVANEMAGMRTVEELHWPVATIKQQEVVIQFTMAFAFRAEMMAIIHALITTGQAAIFAGSAS